MNWNKTLFPARSILIGWPTIRDTGASPGLIQARAGLPNVAPPISSFVPINTGWIARVVSPDDPVKSAASLLAKAGAAKRAETAKAKRDRVHAELGTQ
jgi:hypothetical protein